MLAEECQVLAEEYHECFEDLNDFDFMQAVKIAKQKCKFLPTPADIRTAHDNRPLDKQPEPNLPALPASAGKTDQQMRRENKICANMLNLGLNGNQRARAFLSKAGFSGSVAWEQEAESILGDKYPAQVKINFEQQIAKEPSVAAQQ